MSWVEVEKINSWAKKGVPLNHLIWLNDYKTYGENSYVFQNKDILNELCGSYFLTMNDSNLANEALAYAIKQNQVGNAFRCMYGSDSLDWSGIHSMEDIANNDNILLFVLSHKHIRATCMNEFAKIETAMNKICSSTELLSLLYDSYMDITDSFAGSQYLLSACEKSSIYEVIENADSVHVANDKSRRTHYNNKCFILGMSQTYKNNSSYHSYADTLNGTKNILCSSSYGTTGLEWRINSFANSAKCLPCFIPGTSSTLTDTTTSYMAILKIA